MLTNTHYLARHAISFVIGLIALFTLLNIGDQNAEGLFTILGLIAFIVLYWISNNVTLYLQKNTLAKRNQLSRSEFLQIEEQLTLALNRANELNKRYIQIRSVKSFRVIYDMSKLAKRIISIVKNNPTKFYLIEEFFYAHLPSALELSDKYALLTKEKVSGTDIHIALNDTRKTLKELYDTMEIDLKKALATDIDALKMELDFAKMVNKEQQADRKIGGDN